MRLCAAGVTLSPLVASAATAQEVSTTVRREVAARPDEGPAILNRNLRALPAGERTRFATSAYAASLEGVPRNSDRVVSLFDGAVSAAPQAVLGLMEVAHRAAPDRIVEITEIALKHAGGRGPEPDFKGERDYKGANMSDQIVAKAIELAPGQRLALTRLLGGGVSGGGLVIGPAIISGAAISGTINPANIGGNVIVVDAPSEEVSPSE